MFLGEIFLSSKGCFHLTKAASSCALRKVHPKIHKMQQILHELRCCTDLPEDCHVNLI